MSAADDQIAATIEQLSLTMRATVGACTTWATVAKADLKCTLNPVGTGSAAGGGARAELASLGSLEWESGYAMPAGARVEVDAYPGQRWTVRAGTVWPEFGPDGGRINWRADVARAS